VVEPQPVPAAQAAVPEPVVEPTPVVGAVAPASEPAPETLRIADSPRLDTVAHEATAADKDVALLDAEGVGILAAGLMGVVTLALTVLAFVTARRSPTD
jgi:hypothetical protein